MANFTIGKKIARRAFVVIFKRSIDRTFEAMVDLDSRSLVSWREIVDVQPPLMTEDATLADRVVRGDERWQAAVRARSSNDLGQVVNTIMPSGNIESVSVHPRSALVVSYEKSSNPNGFASPIEGLAALVDLTNLKVIRLIEDEPVRLSPSNPIDPASESVVLLSSPPSHGNPAIERRGHEVQWRNWSFRHSFNAREGLVLHDIRFRDDAHDRSVIARASLSEMVVPYGGAVPTWRPRGPFDVGEFNLGLGAVRLKAGTDCPHESTMLDVVLYDEFGRPKPRSGVVAVYERDGGVLWRHQDILSGRNAAHWAKELVVTWTTIAGNYDYTFEWTFKEDGTIASDVILNGVVSVMKRDRLAMGDNPADQDQEHHVTDDLLAVHHQHFFCYRIDFDVDGAAHNQVMEVDAAPIASADGERHSTAFGSSPRVLRRESTAMGRVDPSKARTWKVVNAGRENPLGQPPGYSLIPGENSLSLSGPDSVVRKRAGFVDAHVWVTPYDPGQMFAAGPYPNQGAADTGLMSWCRADRPIDDADVVVWYTMGVTHLPRPEDWPIMSGHRAGFQIKPNGFFVKNPAY